MSLPELIKKDDVVGVRNFLDKNKMYNYSNWDDYNLLIDLLESGQKEMTKLFIENGFRLNRVINEWRNRTPLHIAVRKGYLDIVEMLLVKGASTTAKNDNKETPLILAAIIENNEITDMILSMVTADNQLNHEGFSHMHVACIRNRTEIVKKFLQNGVKINHAVYSKSLYWPGYTPLHFAVYFKCIETVEFLVSNGADITAKDRKGLTPLHLAFRIQNESMIDTILSAHRYRATNPVNPEGLSHFHIACTRNNLGIIKDFVQRGVKVDHTISNDSFNWKDYSAISFAIEYKRTNVAKFLIAHNAKLGIIKNENVHHHVLHACCEANQVIIDLLLSLQINKNFSELRKKYPSNYRFFYKENKFTVINEAVPNKNYVDNAMDCDSIRSATISQLVVERNQNQILGLLQHINTDFTRVKDTLGKTALHLAFDNNKMLVVNKILSIPSIIEENAVDNSDLSHFHISCTMHDSTIIDKYLAKGVDINSSVKLDATFWPGFTPLHFAIKFKQTQAVQLLLNHGADILVKNGLGLTPLDLAVQCIARMSGPLNDETRDEYRLYLKIIELILSSNVSRKFASIDDKGLSLLHIASARDDFAAVKRLVRLETINKTVDASLPIFRGYTPLHMAAHFGSLDAIRLLLDKGADASTLDAEGNTPAHRLYSNDYESFSRCDFRLLLTKKNSSSVIDHRLGVI